jgi:hypothetical protein
MTDETPQKTNPELIKALAREAKDVLEDRVFTTAVRALHAQWYGELLATSDPDKMGNLVAKLQALEAIPQMLRHFMDSEKMAQNRGTNARRN